MVLWHFVVVSLSFSTEVLNRIVICFFLLLSFWFCSGFYCGFILFWVVSIIFFVLCLFYTVCSCFAVVCGLWWPLVVVFFALEWPCTEFKAMLWCVLTSGWSCQRTWHFWVTKMYFLLSFCTVNSLGFWKKNSLFFEDLCEEIIDYDKEEEIESVMDLPEQSASSHPGASRTLSASVAIDVQRLKRLKRALWPSPG